MSKLATVIDALDDHDSLTVATIRRLLRADAPEGPVVRWIKLAEAAEVMDVATSTLRSRAAQWYRMQERGAVPPVRVRKSGSSDGSPWLCHQGDVYALARREDEARGEAAQRDDPVPVNEREAVLRHYEDLATRDL